MYRDWLISTINRDMPIDQFTIEQLAGDLLPDATREQRIATGFHRNSLKNDEGGIDREEDRCKVAVERTATTGAIWLGLTVGCAECHTHKYDPVTHREFYQLYAFFNETADVEIPAPGTTELEAYARDLKTWEAKHAELERPLDAYLQTLPPATLAQWERERPPPAARWTVLPPDSIIFATEDDEFARTPEADHSIVSQSDDPIPSRFLVGAKAPAGKITAFRIETLAAPGKKVGRSRRGDFALSEFSVTAQLGSEPAKLIKLATARSDFAAPKNSPENTLDGRLDSGWSVAPEVDTSHVIVFDLATPQEFPPGTKFYFELKHQLIGVVSRFRISATTAPSPEPSPISDGILALFNQPAHQRTAPQQLALARHLATQVDPAAQKMIAALKGHDAKRPDPPATTAAILAPATRKTHIHIRGDFLRKGDEVGPATLAVLHPFKPRGAHPDRLDLARWLVDPANPLTARVTVNRIWQNLFGRGIVATVEDFGARGEAPSHPELLDYLATELIRLGWSRKKIIRFIVTSATYRRSSVGRDDLEARDPLNVLLARQGRLRLEAEVVRDTFLAASGLLNPAIGGPSIFPAMPQFVANVGRERNWPVSSGADLYRRSLYIHTRRSVPYPMLTTFDAPDPSVACLRRERTNTPVQALTLLNDPVFVECAQALAKKLTGNAATVEERLQHGFEQCMSRSPEKEELASLRRLYQDQLDLYHGDATAALAAVARVIMNLDEFITRE